MGKTMKRWRSGGRRGRGVGADQIASKTRWVAGDYVKVAVQLHHANATAQMTAQAHPPPHQVIRSFVEGVGGGLQAVLQAAGSAQSATQSRGMHRALLLPPPLQCSAAAAIPMPTCRPHDTCKQQQHLPQAVNVDGGGAHRLAPQVLRRARTLDGIIQKTPVRDGTSAAVDDIVPLGERMGSARGAHGEGMGSAISTVRKTLPYRHILDVRLDGLHRDKGRQVGSVG